MLLVVEMIRIGNHGKSIQQVQNLRIWRYARSYIYLLFKFLIHYLFLSILLSYVIISCVFFCFCCHLEWFSRAKSQTWVTLVIKSYTKVCLQRRVKEQFILYIRELLHFVFWHYSRLLVSLKCNGSKIMPENFEYFLIP